MSAHRPSHPALAEAFDAIVEIIDNIESEDLPRYTEEDDGTLWFPNLNMGWRSASHPESLAEAQIAHLFAAESAGRELVRRKRATQSDSAEATA